MPEEAPGNPGAVRTDAQPAARQAAQYRKVREMQAKLHLLALCPHASRVQGVAEVGSWLRRQLADCLPACANRNLRVHEPG